MKLGKWGVGMIVWIAGAMLLTVSVELGIAVIVVGAALVLLAGGGGGFGGGAAL